MMTSSKQANNSLGVIKFDMLYSFHMIISKNTNLIILLYTSITGYTIYFGIVKVIITITPNIKRAIWLKPYSFFIK